MKALLKSWLLLIESNCFFNKKQGAFLCVMFFYSGNAQITNYVNNGSFESCLNCNQSSALLVASYWSSLDTNKFHGAILTALPPSGQVPNNSYTYQWPRSGNNYFISTLIFKPNFPQTLRGYPRNRLKQPLQFGKTYCFKLYYNITNQSSFGVDGLGVYFGSTSLDTIIVCEKPISYLTPQIQNPTNNFLTDTLNWNLLTGTFTANGTEKYLVLGNFKSDASTSSVMINPANLPVIFCDILYDDVSVIDIDLPAYAGPDIWGIPTTTVYLGRPQDVGIDEACMWYKLPNNTTAIDTAAGITVTVGLTTNTYVVRQEICGNVKWDTVVVYPSATGLSELEYFKNNISLFPNPAADNLNITLNFDFEKEFTKIEILNSLGQLIREEEINFKNKNAAIKTGDLPNGVYLLNLIGDNSFSVGKRFTVAR